MGVNSSAPLRQDLLRGLRWGMILLIAVLMAIAGYRMFGTSPAAAAPRVEMPAAPVTTEPAIQAGEGTPIEDAAPAIKGPDVPPAPPPRRRTPTPEPEPPTRSKAFIPPEVATPRAAMKQDLTEPLPDLATVDVKPAAVGAPKAMVNEKVEEKGSRAGKIARSVGRVFGIGRKDEKDEPEPTK